MQNAPNGTIPGETGDAPDAMAHLRHHLRTPLNHIIGYSDLLIEDAAEEGHESLLPDLNKIKSAGTTLLALLNEALDSKKIGAGRLGAATGPAADMPAPEPSCAEEAAAVAPGRILVVDDSGDNREMLARRLRAQGHAVVEAGDGRQALEAAETEEFDVILLDILMPVLDGYQTLSRLKAHEGLCHIPVLMISAYDELESVVRCIQMGAEDYLPKPINATLLGARLNSSLEKKRLRDGERRLYAQLQESFSQLQTLENQRDDLTHMIVHDLRTPVTSLLSGLQTVGLLGDLNTDQQEFLGIAESGGKTLLHMINDLLDISKMESGSCQLETQAVRAGSLMADALQQVSPLLQENGLTLVREIADDLPALRADEDKMVRVLTNLLGNAIKFTPDGGTVTLSAHPSAAEAAVVFAVRDTGRGIPREAFARIFEKFGQAQMDRATRHQSTGLGLTFCKMIVELHGGRIWVESELDQGSVFLFTLPVA
jgi:two-component system sensor histidine kinase/response regulator